MTMIFSSPQWIPMSEIELVDETQARLNYDPEAIKEYTESYKDSSDICDTPIKLVRLAGHDKYVIIDGHHRFYANRNSDGRNILAIVGSESVDNLNEALALAAFENATFGVRLTAEDKRNCVKLVLLSQTYGEMSTTEIAKKLHVGYSVVNNVRKDLVEQGLIERKETASEKAEKAIEENADRSNCDIAKELGIDEKTVRNARKSLEKKQNEPEPEPEPVTEPDPVTEKLNQISQNEKERMAVDSVMADDDPEKDFTYVEYADFFNELKNIQKWLDDNPLEPLMMYEDDTPGVIAAKTICNTDEIDGIISKTMSNVMDLLNMWADSHGYQRKG